MFPILLCWLIYAPCIIYFKYFFNWDAFNFSQILLIVFFIIFGFCTLFSIAAFLLLELIEQLERGQKLRISKAIYETFIEDIPRAFPIIIIWSLIFFILTVLEALVSKEDKKDKGEFSLKNAAKTLAGYEKFSLTKLTFDALQKGLRMMAFLIYPAIAWENLSTIKAIKKGFTTLRMNVTECVSGYLLTWAAAAIVFFPPGLLLYISDKADLELPDPVWLVTIIYIAFAWSFTLYLEQMFTALLYMWNKKWEAEVYAAEKAGKPIPKLRDVKQPSLLDDIPDLI